MSRERYSGPFPVGIVLAILALERLSCESIRIGVGTGVIDCVKKSRLPLTAVSVVIHGTTICTNVLVERKGARVGTALPGQ